MPTSSLLEQDAVVSGSYNLNSSFISCLLSQLGVERSYETPITNCGSAADTF